MQRWLARLEMRGVEDFELRRIADDRTALTLFADFDVPPNSDYFPVVDIHADRARFLNQSARELLILGNSSLPITEMLDRSPRQRVGRVSELKWPTSERVREAQAAEFARRFLLGKATAAQVRSAVSPNLQHLINFKMQLIDCRDTTHLRDTWDSILVTASLVNVSLPEAGSRQVWERVARSPCHRTLDDGIRRWISLFEAIGRRDAESMASLAESQLQDSPQIAAADLEYLYATAMLGRLARGEVSRARQLVEAYEPRLPAARRQHPTFAFLRHAAMTADR